MYILYTCKQVGDRQLGRYIQYEVHVLCEWIHIWQYSRLEDRFTAEKERTNHSKQEESDLIEFSMFMAEMFYRVRVRNDEV